MGCFSFICQKKNRGVESTSFDGDAVHLFLLKDGNVIEHMHGNYDSYGNVFKKGFKDSFEWDMEWDDVCDLMFNENEGDGIAAILASEWKLGDDYPTIQSEDDPNQGWGSEDELMGDVSSGGYPVVEEPYHIKSFITD
tara:strand:+ start:1192 stop:1605 length:414 start_codon:yes stop_codon:yes gene_type:complete